mgnify:CR=1 FL=1
MAATEKFWAKQQARGAAAPATPASGLDDNATRNELRLMILLLLRPDTSMHRKVIERAYARNAELCHPLFVVVGRDAIVRVLTLWSAANSRLSATVHNITLSGNSALIELTQHIQLRFLPFLPLEWRMFVELDYQPGPNGTKVITRQRDIYVADWMLRSVALGRVVHDLVQVVGTLWVYLVCFVAQLYDDWAARRTSKAEEGPRPIYRQPAAKEEPAAQVESPSST